MTLISHKSESEQCQKEYVARELYKISKQDLIAAKVLYQAELYPEALFFLQQSVEKGYKSYHLFSEMGTSSEGMLRKNLSIRDIGHVPTKITEKLASDLEERFTKIKKDLESLPNSNEIYEVTGVDYSELIRQSSELKKKFSSLSSRQEISKKMRLHELDNLLGKLSPMLKMSNRGVRNIKNIIFDDAMKEEMKQNALKIISPFLKYSPALASEEIDKINNLFGKDFVKLEPVLKIIMRNPIESGCINVIYSNLSIITQSHESSTRYPNIDNSPLSVYTSRHPLIRRFNALIRLTGIAHRKFDGVLSSLETQQ